MYIVLVCSAKILRKAALGKSIDVFIIIVVGMAVVTYIYQMRINAKVKKSIGLITKWFDYIVAHPTDFDLKTAREFGDEVDRYFSEKDVGKKIMYFAPKLRSYIVDRYGKLPGESNEVAFKRLAHWEGDQVRLDVYWTIVQGSFAEYVELLQKGRRQTFAGVSAPVAIIRRYWKL